MSRANVAYAIAVPAAALLLSAGAAAQEWRGVDPAPVTAPAVVAISPVADPAPLVVPAPTPAAPEAWQPDFLQRLPKPPAQPASLYEAAPPARPFSSPVTAGPYFVTDPLLDPPTGPQPGWYGAISVQAAVPHVFKSINNTVTAGFRGPDVVDLTNRGLNWTAMPRLELGYRLPSGFGGVSLAYSSLSSSGSSTIPGPDGPADLHSRLSVNFADLDYESWEYTPNDRWTMRWRFGARYAVVYYDSVLSQSGAVAGPGSGILQQHVTNKFTAFGPHGGVELTRRFDVPGLSMLGRVDVGSLFGRINQTTSELAFDPASPGGLAFGQSGVSSSQTGPTLNFLLGVNYRPPTWKGLECFAGYQYQYWWNVGRYSLNPASRGELSMHGFVAQVRFNY